MKTSTDPKRSIRRLAVGLIASAAAFLSLVALPAAAQAGPEWRVYGLANSNAPAGGTVTYQMVLYNVGDATAACGGPSCQFDIEVPAGLTVQSANWTGPGGFASCTNLGTPGPTTMECTGGSGSQNPFSSITGLLTAAVDPGLSEGTELTTRFNLYGPTDSGATQIGGAPCDGSPPGTPCARGSETVVVSDAEAEAGLDAFDARVSANRGGDAYTAAAGTPYSASTSLSLSTETKPYGFLPQFTDNLPVEALKDISIDLPAGFVGNPASTPTCTLSDLAFVHPSSPVASFPLCQPESQVGAVTVGFGADIAQEAPVFNMDAGEDAAARFGFALLGTTVVVDAEPRTASDNGVTATSRNTSAGLALTAVDLELWGVPADPIHDRVRACPGTIAPFGQGPTALDPFCVDDDGNPQYERPPLTSFLRNPTSCTGPVDTTAHVSSWQNPGAYTSDGRVDLSDPDWKSATSTSHNPPGFPLHPSDWGSPQGVTGCNAVPFNPEVTVTPTTNQADSPTGLDVEISLPQTSDPSTLGSSDLKDAVVTLPEGFTVNPSSADGLESCTLEQVDLDGQNTEADCPDASKVGTVEIDTPVLEDPLDGSVFVAEPDDPDQAGQENPFDSLIALYIVAEGPGTVIKLPGEVALDENSGQVHTTFSDQPQLPFSHLSVEFFDGPRSPIATPPICGTGDAEAELTPWARPGSPVVKTDSLEITEMPGGEPCPATLADRPFEPTMKAGLVDPTAGAFTPFTFRLERPDGHQEILSTEVSPPEGVTAKLAGVPLCSDADANAGTCGAESMIGSAIVGAGAGPSPFYIQAPNEGRVYLAEAYDPDGGGPAEEAPLSMLIQVPAIAGPFDLGVVNVRAATYVDPETAQLNVVSDELPQILEGIPLRVRDIRVKVDRDEFTVAPTDCSEQQVTGIAYGSHGAEADLSQRFQVGDCTGLEFDPEFDFVANNKDATQRSDHPALDTTVDLNQPDGAYASANGTRPQANISRAVVTLPKSIILDQDSLETICTRADYADDNCPENTKYGTAIAHSPLLDEPLQGPVYLRASDNPLPDLVADLNGIIDVDLAGAISQTGGQNSKLRTTFGLVPDVAVSSFNLKLDGGNDGLLVNSENVCASQERRTVAVKVFAQNGLTAHQAPRISVRACEAKADRKADRLERQAKKLKRKAKKAKRKGNKKKARKLKHKANRKLRKARKTRRAAS